MLAWRFSCQHGGTHGSAAKPMAACGGGFDTHSYARVGANNAFAWAIADSRALVNVSAFAFTYATLSESIPGFSTNVLCTKKKISSDDNSGCFSARTLYMSL